MEIPAKLRGRWLLAALLAGLAGIAAGRGLIGSVSIVDGQSMEPTFHNGTRFTTRHIAGPLQRGDVVVVDDGGGSLALKRIVGLPGETLRLYRGYVFVNTRLLREPYLAPHTFTFPAPDTQTNTWALGNEEYFVMGDNRFWSVDSRRYGPVARDRIKSLGPVTPAQARPRFDAFRLPARDEPRLIARRG